MMWFKWLKQCLVHERQLNDCTTIRKAYKKRAMSPPSNDALYGNVWEVNDDIIMS